MATDHDDLDLDQLDAELSDQLDSDDEELAPRERHTLSQIRAALRRTKGKIEKALEDGKAIGRDEEQRDAAWRAAKIPDSARVLFNGVDPRDEQALQARAEELQQSGLRWGDESAAAAARVEDEQRAATLSRMSSLAAGGSVPDVQEDKAAKIKARIDSHQPVSDEELAWFLAHVEGAADAITTARWKGF